MPWTRCSSAQWNINHCLVFLAMVFVISFHNVLNCQVRSGWTMTSGMMETNGFFCAVSGRILTGSSGKRADGVREAFEAFGEHRMRTAEVPADEAGRAEIASVGKCEAVFLEMRDKMEVCP